VSDPALVGEISEIGIIFLLLLVSLDLQPSKLRNTVGKTFGTALVTSAITYVIMTAFGYGRSDARASMEVGVRLGQMSEFSLLVVYLATSSAPMSAHASHIVQGAPVLTFVLSTYLVMFTYPSPIAVTESLRRD
jgi:Kef-type K+ transport system membrane component KefB